MCGIVGVFGKEASEEQLKVMLKTQKHRGPNHIGIYVDEHLAIGHNRLSIIDLDRSANQPFISNDKCFILSFNGEIYNYLELKDELKHDYNFKTESDTEVLLAAYIKWGTHCLDKFNGMFAFFIWDTLKKQLFVARDRFGVKPLYYTIVKDTLFIASEIKTLVAGGIDDTPNERVWANYFAYGSYGLPNQTFYKGIQQLEAGHFFIYNDGHLKKQCWYNFEAQINRKTNSYSINEAKEYYLDLLKNSIMLRFRADVPVGFNVSGGLDSSLLLALVNTLDEGKNVNAYTFYTNNKNYDELPWVKQLLTLTDNPLKKVLFSANDVISSAEEMSYLQDEPFGGVPTLAYASIFKTAVSQGVKVLLDGQGIDEQWAGYDYYSNNSNSVVQGVKTSPMRPNVLDSDFLKMAAKSEYQKPFDDEVLNLQYRDLFYTKIPRALRFNDRISMAYSTELREPFLDYRLVEFAFKQPLGYKIKDGDQKYLPRLISKDFLPESISFAPKRPLQTPQREWLGNELKDWVISHVSILKKHHWFNEKVLDEELNSYFSGSKDSGFHIWQWVNTAMLLS